MKNTIRNKIKFFLIAGFIFSINNLLADPISQPFQFNQTRILPKLNATLTGPYFGYQRGKIDVIEAGMERQWKQFKLVHPVINAAHFGINYNFKNNIMGYDIGYWRKKGRINFTYGVNLCLRTNFNQSRIGFTPTLGYKVWQLHLQTGYHFLTNSSSNFETNTFFITARFVIINDIDFKFKRKNKN